MDVTVQISGSPASVAEFLRVIGSQAALTINNFSQEDVETTNNPFNEVPNTDQEALSLTVGPSEDGSAGVQSEPKVTFEEMRRALSDRGVRYKAAHGSDVSTAKEFLLRICEEIGGAEPGSGSGGIKPENYWKVYDFCIHDRDF